MFYDIFMSLCEQKHVSPSAVMREIGLNKSSATYWKKGSAPSSGTIQKLSDYFNVSPGYLLGIESKEEPTSKPKISEEDMQAAFWGGDKDLSKEDWDAMWDDVSRFAAFLAEQKRKEKQGHD